MNNQALFLFLILLAGLVLCSCLGHKEGFEISTYTGVNSGHKSKDDDDIRVGAQGNIYGYDVQNKWHTDDKIKGTDYDNYNHFDKSSYPTMYYGPSGETAKLVNSNGNYSIIVTNGKGNTSTYNVNTNTTTYANAELKSSYSGANGGKATIINYNGKNAVKVTDSNNNTTLYIAENNQTYNPNYPNINGSSDSTNKNYNSGTNIDAAYTSGPYGGSIQGSDNQSSNAWQSALPAGIPASQIPHGKEDLYILKSQVVPPVCPVCPTCQANSNNSSNSGSSSSSPWGSSDSSKCPPCPACARCPESSFECKKVPNYNAINNDYLPQPVLNNFNNFGM